MGAAASSATARRALDYISLVLWYLGELLWQTHTWFTPKMAATSSWRSQGSNPKSHLNKPPFTLTWPFLASLALYIIGLIVALELCRSAFPSVDDDIQAGEPPVKAGGSSREGMHIAPRATRSMPPPPANARHGAHPTPLATPTPTAWPKRRPWRRNVTETNCTYNSSTSCFNQSVATNSSKPKREPEPFRFGDRWAFPLDYAHNWNSSSLRPRRPVWDTHSDRNIEAH